MYTKIDCNVRKDYGYIKTISCLNYYEYSQ